jgi:hypothetical protein
MIAIRKSHPALCCGKLEWVDCGTKSSAAFLRTEGQDRMLIIHNLSSTLQDLRFPFLEHVSGKYENLLTGKTMEISQESPTLSLLPFEFLWLLNT